MTMANSQGGAWLLNFEKTLNSVPFLKLACADLFHSALYASRFEEKNLEIGRDQQG